MTYLDYSATTKPDKEVLESFIKSSDYFANPNSLHTLGVKAKKLIEVSTKQIAQILKIKPSEIIYTSGATESNNTAIKAVETYLNRGNEIITTALEHSSIYGPLKQMEEKGIKIKYVKLKNGIVDLEDLEKQITNKTILVTINAVNSETGIKQPIEKIGKLLKKYPKIIFHTDLTQAIGKIKIDLENIDLASLSAHKFYGLKGIGILIKKENINLTPLISGGKSTTIYRSGTPATPLIVSTAKALRLITENLEEDYKKIEKLNQILKENLKKYQNVYINSTENSIPHILNISIIGIKPETMLHALEEDEIYISTQSACATQSTSKSVLAITQNKDKAKTSIRISLSKYTTKKDLETFLKSFDKNYKKLTR